MLDDADTFETTTDPDCWWLLHIHGANNNGWQGVPWAITKNGNLSLYLPDWVWGAFSV